MSKEAKNAKKQEEENDFVNEKVLTSKVNAAKNESENSELMQSKCELNQGPQIPGAIPELDSHCGPDYFRVTTLNHEP